MGESFLTTEFSGDGSPEGAVKAIQGAVYTNLTGGGRWRKSTGPHLSIGWELLASGDFTITADQISDATPLGVELITLANPVTPSFISAVEDGSVVLIAIGEGGVVDTAVTPNLEFASGLFIEATA